MDGNATSWDGAASCGAFDYRPSRVAVLIPAIARGMRGRGLVRLPVAVPVVGGWRRAVVAGRAATLPIVGMPGRGSAVTVVRVAGRRSATVAIVRVSGRRSTAVAVVRVALPMSHLLQRIDQTMGLRILRAIRF